MDSQCRNEVGPRKKGQALVIGCFVPACLWNKMVDAKTIEGEEELLLEQLVDSDNLIFDLTHAIRVGG